MTNNEAIELFRTVTDDQSVGEELILAYLNTGLDELALERAWIWLIAVDTSMTWATSDNYLTAHTVPANFLYQLTVYAAGITQPFEEVPLEHRERYQTTFYRCYFNHALRKLYFVGTTDTNRTVTLSYIVSQDDLIADGTEIPYWPSKLHRMLVYKAADLYLGGTDADSITKVMAPKFLTEWSILKKRASMLDAKLRGKSRNFQTGIPMRDLSRQPNVLALDE